MCVYIHIVLFITLYTLFSRQGVCHFSTTNFGNGNEIGRVFNVYLCELKESYF